jgi:hypothetical protein
VSTRRKGNEAPDWLAEWLRPWFPDAEKTPNGRRGRDVDNTPGLAIEVKTGAEWRPLAWRKQAEGYAAEGELPLLVYYPPGFGKASTGDTLSIVRTRLILPVLVEAGYAPERRPRGVADALDLLDRRDRP